MVVDRLISSLLQARRGVRILSMRAPWSSFRRVRSKWACRAHSYGYKSASLDAALEDEFRYMNVEFPLREQFIDPFIAQRDLPAVEWKYMVWRSAGLLDRMLQRFLDDGLLTDENEQDGDEGPASISLPPELPAGASILRASDVNQHVINIMAQNEISRGASSTDVKVMMRNLSMLSGEDPYFGGLPTYHSGPQIGPAAVEDLINAIPLDEAISGQSRTLRDSMPGLLQTNRARFTKMVLTNFDALFIGHSNFHYTESKAEEDAALALQRHFAGLCLHPLFNDVFPYHRDDLCSNIVDMDPKILRHELPLGHFSFIAVVCVPFLLTASRLANICSLLQPGGIFVVCPASLTKRMNRAGEDPQILDFQAHGFTDVLEEVVPLKHDFEPFMRVISMRRRHVM